jgi:hypothetical protein
VLLAATESIRRDVADVSAVHASIPGAGGRDHPSPHGVEGGPDGGGILEVRRRGLAPDGHGDDVHAVGDGGVRRSARAASTPL